MQGKGDSLCFESQLAPRSTRPSLNLQGLWNFTSGSQTKEGSFYFRMLVFCVTSEESPQIRVLKSVIMDKCLSFFFLAKTQHPDKSNLGEKGLFLLQAKGTVHHDGEFKVAEASSSCSQSKRGKGCSAFFLHQQSPGSLPGVAPPTVSGASSLD